MGKIAFMFSGQGAQFVGMGKDFYENVPCVKNLFDNAETMRKGTLDLMFLGDDAELKKTENTQPCMYLADLGAARALESFGVKPDAVAGFSLGEIAALAYSGVYSDSDGFSLVCKRGEAMAKASSENPASMAAVIKLANEKVEELCEKAGAYPVNYNSPGQLVVSGSEDALAKLAELVKAEKGRVLPLKVSGGFHSPFMNSASKEFGEVLENFEFKAPEITAYSNYTAKPYDKDIKNLLELQINHPVHWETIIRTLLNEGFDTFIEVGVGSTLQKLCMKIADGFEDVKILKCENTEDAKLIAEQIL